MFIHGITRWVDKLITFKLFFLKKSVTSLKGVTSFSIQISLINCWPVIVSRDQVSELPRYWCNFTIAFLDFFAWIGWATDLKTVSDEMIRKRVLRTGDGTHKYSKEELTNKQLIEAFNNSNNNDAQEEHVDTLWGWGELL